MCQFVITDPVIQEMQREKKEKLSSLVLQEDNGFEGQASNKNRKEKES